MKVVILEYIIFFFISLTILMCGEGLELLTEPPSTIDWTEWSYRRPVTITENSGTALSNYQVNISLNNTNFSFANAQTNGEDIRFNYNDESLSYWIESWNQAGETGSVWVKVPSIPSSGNRIIYIYYGNSSQSSESDFSGTFTKNFLSSGLVGQWHMDEGSGSSLTDSSSYTNTATISDGTWNGFDGGGWYDRDDVSFSSGDSLTLDGTNDYAEVSDDNSLDVNYITIEAWIRTGSDVASTQYIVSKWTETGDQRSYALSIESSTIYFSTSSSGTALSTDNMNRGAISTNTTYHIAATSDGTDKIIYINGTQSGGTSGWGNTIYAGTSSMTFGAKDNTPASLFSGRIDEVKIYSGALSAAEIESHSKRSKYVNPVPTYVVGSEETTQ